MQEKIEIKQSKVTKVVYSCKCHEETQEPLCDQCKKLAREIFVEVFDA
jgi:hypothetical protein